jgi:3-phytase
MIRGSLPVVPRALLAMLLAAVLTHSVSQAQTVITPRDTLAHPLILDQDDMCIWIHPSDPALSAIIASDKTAGKLFVYDLAGDTLQVVHLPCETCAGGVRMPGNIDVRYRFDLQGNPTDIVGFNDRLSRKLLFYRMDPQSRTLERIDTDAIGTAQTNYGFCLYVSPISGKYYAFSSTQNGVIEQFELTDASGQIGATLVRTWHLGEPPGPAYITEGSVCDDENAVVFFGEEDVAIWKFGAEPGDPTVGTAVATVGDASGIAADIEGLTLYYAANGEGYLIASSQGTDSYRVYQRKAPHAFVDSFSVAGARNSDGIDVTNVNLGPSFPKGAFVLHNGRIGPFPVEMCAYEDLGLLVDTEYWKPRDGATPTLIALGTAHAEPGRVRLTWYGGDAAGRRVTIYRRTDDSEWTSLASVVADGTGVMEYEDRDVQPGVRYGYRLGIQEDGAEVLLGEVWVEVPTGFQLALPGLRPNPSEHDLVIAFSLRDGRPAELGIFDAAGRRRWTRHVESLGAGNHVLNLGRMVDLSPGVYVLRITQGDDSISRRAVILR